jgi:hypothetical protein
MLSLTMPEQELRATSRVRDLGPEVAYVARRLTVPGGVIVRKLAQAVTRAIARRANVKKNARTIRLDSVHSLEEVRSEVVFNQSVRQTE